MLLLLCLLLILLLSLLLLLQSHNALFLFVLFRIYPILFLLLFHFLLFLHNFRLHILLLLLLLVLFHNSILPLFHLLLNRHYHGWFRSTIKSLSKAPAAAHRMLALLLVVFSGIIPNGVAHRLRFCSPINQ